MSEKLFLAHLKKEENENFDWGNREISHAPLELELDRILPFITLQMVGDEKSLLTTVENSSVYNGLFTTGLKKQWRLNFAV